MLRKIIAIATSAVASLTLSASVAAGTPVETGCPAAFEAKTVAQWEALDERYRLPAEIDDADLAAQQAPFDGVAGNEDGIVCGLAMPTGFTWGWAVQARGIPSTEAPELFYQFIDNSNPAYR